MSIVGTLHAQKDALVYRKAELVAAQTTRGESPDSKAIALMIAKLEAEIQKIEDRFESIY